MTIRVYTLYDHVSETLSPLSFARTDAEAIRTTERAFRNAESTIKGFRSRDFNLYCIGTYDDSLIQSLNPIIPPLNVDLEGVYDGPKE